MRIGKLAGFELRIHWSTLVIFGLLVWSLATVQLPEHDPDASGTAHLVAALIAGVAFYIALLAHELSHALVARREGIEVESLTLWILGGVATLRGEPRTPGADLRIAAVGPVVSITFGIVFAVAAIVADASDASALVVATLGWLAGINIVLGLFNLIPAAPLDGGRILRSALWALRGDRSAAAKSAARAGEIFGYVLVGVGLLGFFVPGVGGLWFIVLGWFLLNAARAEQMQTELRDALRGVPVAAAMTRDPVTAPEDLTVAEILDGYVMATRHSAFPLRDRFGAITGLVTLNRLRGVPPERRGIVRVIEVACPIDEVTTARPDEPLVDLLPRLSECADGRVLVFDDDGLVGIVTPSDVTRLLAVLGIHLPSPPTSRPAPPPPPPPLPPRAHRAAARGGS